MTTRLLFKIVVVGDGGVGKSTMIQRLTTGRFIPMKITIGTDLATYHIRVSEFETAKLQVWDFGGEQRFRFFLPNYCRGASGCLLCYDITRYKSLENLEEWYNIVQDNSDNPVFMLVGQKYDLAQEKRAVEHSVAEEFQKNHDISYLFETSSKSGHNTKTVFETLTNSIIERKKLLPE